MTARSPKPRRGKRPKLVNITKSWKRLMAVSCSHGVFADETATAAVIMFRQRFKPHTVIHLGDFVDTTAFRHGAVGTSDEAADVGDDFNAAFWFLSELRPTHILCGNHEARLWKHACSPNAVVRRCASELISQMQDLAAKLGARFVEYRGIWDGVKPVPGLRFGNYTALHGVFYGETAGRDHAEAFGNCIHGHTHRVGFAKGRRADNPTALCPGTLTRIANMDYANTRRGTLGWSQGIVIGYYTDRKASLIVYDNGQDGDWDIPM